MNRITSLTTGTTRGIGAAISTALSRFGDAYWINRNLPEGKGAGGWICDLADPQAVRTTIETIRASNIPFNCLILNAAYRIFSPLDKLSQEQFERAMQVNVMSNFLLLRGMADVLTQSNGCVIVCSSQAATHPFEGGSAYCTSKAALDMLARVFLYEYRHRGIRTCILEMGAVRNRPKPNDDWKLSPDAVAGLVSQVLASDDLSLLLSRIEMIPRDIPRGDEAGPERLHRL